MKTFDISNNSKSRNPRFNENITIEQMRSFADFKVDPETMANCYKRHSSQCIESRSSMAFGSFRKDQDGSEVNLQLQIEYNSKNPTFLPKSTLKAYKFNKHKSSKEPKFHYETCIMKSGSKKLRVPPNLESAFQKRMLRSSVDLRMENKI